MTGVPSVTVTFDASTIDISGYVVATAGVTKTWGKATQFEKAGPGTISLTLDNTDGRFTPGNTAGAYYGKIVKNAPITLWVAGSQVFVGYVDSWVATVDSAGTATTVVVASDAAKLWARSTLGPYGLEMLAYRVRSGGVVYPLSAVKAKASDASTALAPWRNPSAARAEILTGVDNRQRSWASEAPAYLGGSLQLVPSTSGVSGGSCTDVVQHPTTWNPGAGGSFGAWFRTSRYNATHQYVAVMFRTGTATPYAQITISAGNVYATVHSDAGVSTSANTSGSNYADGEWHFASLSVDAATGRTMTLRVDGQFTSSTAASALTISSTGRALVFGGLRTSLAPGSADGGGFEGNLAGIFSSTAPITDVDQIEIYYAAVYGTKLDTIASRSAQLFAFVFPSGTPTPSCVGDTATLVGGQDLDGKSLLDAMNQLADSIRGVFMADTSGAPLLYGGANRVAPAVALTVSAANDLSNESFHLTVDDSRFANRVEGTSSTGTYTAQDAASIAALGPVVDSWGDVVTPMVAAVSARLAARMSDVPRLSTVTIDAATSSVSALSVLALSAVPLARIRITGLPAALGASTQDGLVEGGTLTVSASEFTLAVNMEPVE